MDRDFIRISTSAFQPHPNPGRKRKMKIRNGHGRYLSPKPSDNCWCCIFIVHQQFIAGGLTDRPIITAPYFCNKNYAYFLCKKIRVETLIFTNGSRERMGNHLKVSRQNATISTQQSIADIFRCIIQTETGFEPWYIIPSEGQHCRASLLNVESGAGRSDVTMSPKLNFRIDYDCR
jgi:hypothetical protein